MKTQKCISTGCRSFMSVPLLGSYIAYQAWKKNCSWHARMRCISDNVFSVLFYFIAYKCRRSEGLTVVLQIVLSSSVKKSRAWCRWEHCWHHPHHCSAQYCPRPLRITLQVGIASTGPVGDRVVVDGWVVSVFVFHGNTYVLCWLRSFKKDTCELSYVLKACHNLESKNVPLLKAVRNQTACSNLTVLHLNL